MVRRFNGQREVLRRLEERNEARVERVNAIRDVGGLPPIEHEPFPPPIQLTLGHRHRGFGITTEQDFRMEYMGHPIAPITIDTAILPTDFDRLLRRLTNQTDVVVQGDALNDLQADLYNQGLRDVQTMRVQDRFGMGIIANRTTRNGNVYRHHQTTVRGTTARHIQFHEPNWGELLGYTSNENSKQLLRKDWNVQGEFLEEEKPPPIRSLWGDMTF